ncbi:MAG: type IV pilus assembly protein PilM [Candidatus Yanofskybacteria bacterium]|nr:type IV pilus assembly protein PilM [Candidatus Yanofskybacteria bacterium]
MIFGSFQLVPKVSLGVDIGTSSLKVVELSKWGYRKTLKNYGEMEAKALYEKPFRTFEKNSLLLSSEDVARALRGVIQEAKMESRKAAFSIPAFATFFTNFELPPMTKEELPDAVRFEARRHIPVPISEVVYDWQLLEGKIGQKTPLKVLLVAVPTEALNQYQEIARLAKIQLIGMEAEVFGLLRAAQITTKKAVILVDIGAQSTTVSVVSGKMVHLSHSIESSGNSLTARLSESLSIPYDAAEREKRSKGLRDALQARVLAPLLDLIVLEIQKVSRQFQQSTANPIERVILTGGTAVLPGFREYMEKNMGIRAEILDAFGDIFTPPVLEDVLSALGPSYAVAVGMALKGIE